MDPSLASTLTRVWRKDGEELSTAGTSEETVFINYLRAEHM